MSWILLVLAAAQDPARGVEVAPRLGEPLPADARVRDESGAVMRFGDAVGGGPSLLVFVYYRCPQLCGELQSSLARSLQALPFEPRVAVVSIAPEEGPALAEAAKSAFLLKLGRPGNAAFLTGVDGSEAALAEAAGFRYRPTGKPGDYAHGAAVYVLTPDARVSAAFTGLDVPPRDLRLALVEAGRGAVGSAGDRLLLLCLQYDPASGRYGLSALRVLRLLAAGTLAVLAIGVLRSLRRERRERRAGKEAA